MTYMCLKQYGVKNSNIIYIPKVFVKNFDYSKVKAVSLWQIDKGGR